MKKTKKVLNELKKISNEHISNKDKIINELIKLGFRKISPVDFIFDKKGGYKSIGLVMVKISEKHIKVECNINGISCASDKIDTKFAKINDVDDLIHNTFDKLKEKIKKSKK